MSTKFLHRFWKLIILLVVQLVLLNNLHLLGYISPVIIACLTMDFERGASRIGLLLWGFAAGLLYDVFSNTIGMGMAAATLLGMLQPTLLHLFTPRDAPDDMVPSMRTMGTHRYLLYAFFSLLIFHTVFYLLDAMTLSDWTLTLLAIGCGTLMAFVIVAIAQSVIQRHDS